MSSLRISDAEPMSLDERFSMISSIISNTFCSDLEARPLVDRHKPIQLDWSVADGVSISRAEMSPLTLFNYAKRNRHGTKYCAYVTNQMQSIKLEGRGLIHVQPDDLMILDSNTPYEIVVSRNYVTSCLIVDGELFRDHIPDPSQLVGRRLRLPVALDDVLRTTLDSSWAVAGAGLFKEVGTKLVGSFLDMLSLARFGDRDSDPVDVGTTLDIRRRQVKACIDKHFASPDFSIASIAERLHLSQRYIQLAFATEGITPSEYLRRRRIEACAEMLREAARAHCSITEIAFSCGFNSSAHFSNEFRRAYGTTAREYRAAALSGATHT